MDTVVSVPRPPQAGEHTRNAWAVVCAVGVALLLGWLLKTSVEGRSIAFTSPDGAVSLTYPAAWTAAKSEDGVWLSVSDLYATGMPASFKVYARAADPGMRLSDAAIAWTMSRMTALHEFRDLGSIETTLSGHPAIMLNYGFVADPPGGSGLATLPVVARGRDAIVVLGQQYLVFSATYDAAQRDVEQKMARILDSVSLSGK